MKILYSWLRDFVDVPDGPAALGRRMSLRGLALEGLEPAPPGEEPPGTVAPGEDAVLDFDVTANRPDWLSVIGIAREVATAYDLPLRLPSASAPGHLRSAVLSPVDRASFSVRIDAPELCPRYVGAAADVTVAPSPPWMQRRLTAQGVRPISNVVDVTNYVLLEMGQPMHAFDHARLADNAIVVRVARAGEPLTTLDGKARLLDAGMLVIADAERAEAIGGVMGGAESEVRASSTRIVLESAWFTPRSIRATSKRLGLRSEASTRFERGADPTVQVAAMARACGLLEIIGAGAADGTYVDAHPSVPDARVVPLRIAHVDALLGMAVPQPSSERILAGLGFAATRDATGDAWQVRVPGWRPDVTRPEDLIEEVGRHYGFEHLPAAFPPVHEPPPPSDPRIARDARARRAMLAMGFSEAISFAFIEEAAAAPFGETTALIRLANPLSETFAVMRPSVLPGVIDAVGRNRRHERRDVRLFEIGTAFTPGGEVRSLAAAWTGAAGGDHWSGHRRDVDLFDMTGVVEQVCVMLAVTPAIAAAERPFLVAGRSAAVEVRGRVAGVVGLLAASVAEARGIPRGEAVFLLELDLDVVTSAAIADAIRVEPLPRFPSAVRDLALLVDDSLSAVAVRDTIRAAAPATLVSVREFDRFQGRDMPPGMVSLALRLTFRSADRTLTDDEVSGAMRQIVSVVTTKLGAIQR